MTRRDRFTLSFSTLLAIGALVLWTSTGCQKKEAGAGNKTPAVPVDTAVATVETVQRSVEVIGTLYGEEDATISNKVNGKVIAIYHDIGDRADPGEPLAQLLQNDYILAVNQKRAALLESLGKLGVDDVPNDKWDVTTLPAVRRAKQQTENAQAKYDRGLKLYAVSVQGEKIIRKENPLISDQDFDDLKTALDVARSNYDVELSTAKALIGEARTRLADLRVAEQALADTTIRAPFDKYAGPSEELSARPSTQPSDVPAPPSAENARSPYNAEGKFKRYRVAGRMHSPGELLQAVSGMFTLVDDDPVKLKASVPERYFSDVALGQEVVITAEAYPKECRGKISRINPQIDVTNRTFAIEVLIDNKEHQIPTGVFAHGEILTRKEKALFVPATAISSFAGNYKVFVIENGKVTERQVEIGERRKGPNDVDLIEVTKPKNAKVELKPGETIATSGTSRLANGVAVELKSAPTSAPATHPATLPTEKP